MTNRISALRDKMSKKGMDAIIVTSKENHRYFGTYNNPDGWLLITGKNAYMLADFRYIEAAKREANKDFKVIMPEGKFVDEIHNLIVSENAKIVGYEDDTLSARELSNFIKVIEECEFVPATDIIDELREFKDEAEVKYIVEAQRIAEKSFAQLLKNIKYDMTELEAAAELEYLMKLNGADDKSFDTIAISGASTSSPHGVPQKKKLEKGFMTFDFGALINGYHSDMTRTICIGKADSDMKKLYNTVLKAQMAVLDVISVGKNNFEMDKIARDIIEGIDEYKGCFGHGLGHGVGLYIHEAPRLSKTVAKEKVLLPGQIVTVEPGIYLEGKYGCRIEDMVHITETGSENLTKCPKELIEI